MNISDKSRKDLIILVADKNMEHSLRGLLGRQEALQIRNISFDIPIHVHRDPGVLNEAHEFLRPFRNQYHYCLVIFDREGCGRDELLPDRLQGEVEERLSNSGWNDRAHVVVIDPELEKWVWTDSPEVARILGWEMHGTPLREWLSQHGYWLNGEIKPSKPKDAMDAVLRYVRKPRSSAIYKKLAKDVSFLRCVDPSFLRLKNILKSWFPLN